MGRPAKTLVGSDELFWLLASRNGFPVREIAEAFGAAVTSVWRGIQRAKRAKVPDLEVLFPHDFTPSALCEHEPIQLGDLVYCAVCHQTGVENHPLLVRDPREEPGPEPKPGRKKYRPDPKLKGGVAGKSKRKAKKLTKV